MIIVINAGGSGTRLWPLSTPVYPKHLLKLYGERTMIQATYDRAKTVTDDIYVITEVSHADTLKKQLPELDDDNFIIEPGRRGTAGCFIAALHYLQSRHSHDEPIIIIPADHVIHDVTGLGYSFKAAAIASEREKRIVLIGIEPTYPAPLGYIEKGEIVPGDTLAYHVARFVEKPPYTVAQDYIKSGKYVWNCGYYAGSINTFLTAFEMFSPEWKGYYDSLLATTNEAEYKETYLSFEGTAIEYALSEKADNFMLVPAHCDWIDVGNFKDLHDVVPHDEQGNYFRGEAIYPIDVESAYIRNEENKPIVVIGLDNIVVVNTPNGLLVARKDVSHRVGEVAKKLQG